MSRTTAPSARKEKKSYTLSPESVAFLETMRKKRHAASISSLLDEILQAVRRQHERAALERAVTGYYGSLSDADTTELAEWSAFAEKEFPGEERP
jgi:hypothetical protein